MATQIQHHVSPIGRIVGGDLWKKNSLDATGQPKIVRQGANQGQLREEYFVALAIRKVEAGVEEMRSLIHQAAMQAFPEAFDPSTGACLLPQFAFKYVDGDATLDREGYAGCWVFKFSTGFDIKRVGKEEEGCPPILDVTQFKRGDYARIAYSVAGNGSNQPHTKGVFLNFTVAERRGFGAEISSGPDPKAVLAAAGPAGQLPPGASTVPTSPIGMSAPIATPATAAVSALAPAVAPVATVPVQAPPIPHTGILQPTVAPVATPVAAAVPTVATPVAAAVPTVAPVAVRSPYLSPSGFAIVPATAGPNTTWEDLVKLGYTEATATATGYLDDIPF